MKRKSIFLTVVAVLFASTVWGQGISWPSTVPADVKGRDTIFFCFTADSLYPIELGYDVAGKRLSPEFGDWSLISKTSDDVSAIEYNMDGTKNGGAGNAYKTVGSGRGGLLFQYIATDKQCGLEVNERFWIFVFVLPDFNNVITKDTLKCKRTTGSDTLITFNNSFAEYKDLYEKAGITAAWKHGGSFPNIPTDTLETYTLADTLVISKAPAGYTCGIEGVFNYTLKIVNEIGPLDPRSFGICKEDTVGDLGKRDPNLIFKRNNVNGSYSPSTIGSTGWAIQSSSGLYAKAFTFTYYICDGTTRTVEDSLYLQVYHGNWGVDTATVCRKPGEESVFTYYNMLTYPNIPGGKLPLDEGVSYWYERGLTLTDGALTGNYGTVGDVASLTDKSINNDVLKSNMGYHYLWRPDPGKFPCMVNPSTKLVDSGYLVLIIQDKSFAIDYTAQLCKSSYAGQPFSLNAYTGLSTTWNDGPNLSNISDVPVGTYKYTYNLPADCGPGGNGVFYLKVTEKVKAPSSKTVKYCVQKLPGAINVNDVLGVAVASLKWETISGFTNVNTSFNTTTGILDIGKYAQENGSGEATLTFTATGTGGCGVNTGTTVTLIFTNSIL
jgi:hypothetical protein